MPNLKLTDLASFKAYFEAIAFSHVDIGGFKWGDMDVVRNDNRSNITQSLLVTGPYENVRYEAAHNDAKLKIKRATIFFMKVRTSEKFEDEAADLEFCEAVMDQILAKIDVDKRGGINATGEWEMLVANITSVVSEPVQPKIGSTQYIGIKTQIDFLENGNLSYDVNKWS